jgi:T5SS/PEP-CTERM-associated repeat protein
LTVGTQIWTRPISLENVGFFYTIVDCGLWSVRVDHYDCALFYFESNISNARPARNTGSTGAAMVEGSGSLWQAGRKLFIGSNANVTALTPSGPGGTGAVTVSNGGTIVVGEQVYVGATGRLSGGGGTIVGSIENHGVLAPGNSPGIMDVVGNASLASDGMVEIELGGTNIALMEYDQLNAYDNSATAPSEGKISVGGALKVVLFGGFDPGGGDFFDVFTAFDIDYLSPTWELPTLAAGLSWQHSIVSLGDREALRLQVLGQQAVPLPGTLALLISAGFGFAVTRRSRTASSRAQCVSAPV